MLSDAKPVQSPDTFAAARERLTTGPVPDWVIACPPDYDFAPKNPKVPAAVTLLLWNAQLNAEANAIHVHRALRLETMPAVQSESQWRLEFEPQTQRVTLHWIKIRRGTNETDHTRLDKLHLLQREAGLEGCVIDGCFTALLLLEDVRPGDVLEWCYTVETNRRLLPENRFAFLGLPAATPIGKAFIAVCFAEARPMKWKSSGPDWSPEETGADGQVTWRWAKNDFTGPEPEANVPAWHLAFPWIQVSDCADWGLVAHAMAGLWEQTDDAPEVAGLVEEICAKETELLPRIERALRLVQDEFRYLSVNLEHGGAIPTPVATVARRRFGDCKDLSVLLVEIFRRLGVTARPVLVNTAMRRSLLPLLPSPALFDHAIVQFEVAGETRWVDVTIKNQGGGPLKRVLPNYGGGLVLDAATTQLSPPPAGSVAPGTYHIRESMRLDTTGAGSYVAIVITAGGSEAESLRQQFAHVPVADIAQQRLQHCADRYRQARRIGELQHRDDRETNEFHVAEVFEVNGFLSPSEQPGCCDFFLPPNLVNGSLRLPETPKRRDPFALMQPCNLVHTYDVQTAGFQQSNSPRSRIDSALLHFSRQIRSLPGCWSVILKLDIRDEVLMPDQLEEHTRRVNQIWQESTWRLTLPVGYSAAGRNRSFGALPSPPRPTLPAPAARPAAKSAEKSTGASAPDSRPLVVASAPASAPATSPTAPTAQLRRRRSTSRQKGMRPASPWKIIAIVIGLILLIVILLMASTGGRIR